MARPVLLGLPVLVGLGGVAQAQQEVERPEAVTIEAFLAANGRELDACFKEMPALQVEGTVGNFAGWAPAGPATANRLVLAVDASGSMAARVGGQTKMEAAKRAARDFLARTPPDVAVGLLAFGHRGNNAESGKAESCSSTEMVHAVAADGREAVAAAVARFDATGWTPLAAAITEAGRAFTPQQAPGAQVIYVVSDGKETCGGDPVAAARALHDGPVKAVINIIGFDLAEADRAQLKAVAQAGGGLFVEARTGDELARITAEARRQSQNAREQARTTAANARGEAQNNSRTYRAIAQLQSCVNRDIANELAAFGRWQARLQRSGPDEATRTALAATSDALRTRHDGYRTRLQATVSQAKQANDDANRQIDRATQTNRERLNETR